MASPTTTSSGYNNQNSNTPYGITSLIWGTDGILTSPHPVSGTYAGTGYYIVESVDQETDSEVIHGENGSGQKAWRVTIENGQRWVLSVQDDTAFTPPKIGMSVTIQDAANLIGTTPSAGTYYKYLAIVVSSGERFTRKGAAMRNITVENLSLVDSQSHQA